MQLLYNTRKKILKSGTTYVVLCKWFLVHFFFFFFPARVYPLPLSNLSTLFYPQQLAATFYRPAFSLEYSSSLILTISYFLCSFEWRLNNTDFLIKKWTNLIFMYFFNLNILETWQVGRMCLYIFINFMYHICNPQLILIFWYQFPLFKSIFMILMSSFSFQVSYQVSSTKIC